MKAMLWIVGLVWFVIAGYSGLMFFGFYSDAKHQERVVTEYMASHGVTVDSLKASKNPRGEYLQKGDLPPETKELLTMAMWVQGKTRDPLYWPKQFAQWLVLAGLLPGAGFAGLLWIARRQTRREASP